MQPFVLCCPALTGTRRGHAALSHPQQESSALDNFWWSVTYWSASP
ncbi:hypothetical protein E2C01_064028 [Portunus trituberculatus]|uniref:Uncharacterized protein n=1 Tax=Portunus trituberculatus TaxID=210409 RepID=A0A5B7HKM4_PORTR|nr:hypothetical protein [Portunus trituberculatus]